MTRIATPASAWLVLTSISGAACTGVGIEDTTADPQSVGITGDFRISATIEARSGVPTSSVQGLVVIGQQTFPMTHRAGNAWDYVHRATACEVDVRYTIGGSYHRPNIFVTASPTFAPEGSFTIRRAQQVLWDSDEKLAGAAQLSFIIDLSSDATAQADASLATVTIKNAQAPTFTVNSVSIVSVSPTATGGGSGDVSFFQLQRLSALPAAVTCDQTFAFDVHFTRSTSSRSAALLIDLVGAQDLVISLYGKAFFF